MSDPHWANVIGLWGWEAASPDHLLDESPAGNDLTNQSSFNRATDEVKFGSASAGRTSTAGASRAIRPAADAGDFHFTGAFTLECWFWPHNAGSTSVQGLISRWGAASGGVRQFALWYRLDQGLHGQLSLDGSTIDLALNGGGPISVSPKAWHHACLERNDDGDVRLYLDGVVVDSGTLIGALHNNSGENLDINGHANGNGQAGNRSDEVRITKGVARYNGAFTPPTAAFPRSGPATVDVEGNVGTLNLTAPEGVAGPVIDVEGNVGTLNFTPPEGVAVPSAVVYVSQMGLSSLTETSAEPFLTQFGLNLLTEILTQPRVSAMGLLVLATTGSTPRQPNFLNISDRGREELLSLRTVNMYAEPTPDGPSQWAMFPRPGLKRLATRGAGPVRALFSWIGYRVMVSGSQVYLDGEYFGDLPPDGPVRWAISNDDMVFVVDKRVYIGNLDENGIRLSTNPNLRNVSSVAFLAGRFVYTMADNSGIYRYSDPGQAPDMLDGLSFASAESNPDPITCVEVYASQLVFFNIETIEWHFPTNDEAAPFQRSQGRSYDKGSISPDSVVVVNNALYFVTTDKTVCMAGEVPVPVSDPSVGKALTKLSTDQMREITAYEAYYDQHFWYVLNLPGQGTWAYDTTTRRWHEWDSFNEDRFRISCSDGEVLGDYKTGDLFQFEGRTYDDDGLPMVRVVSSWLPIKAGLIKHYNLVLMCQKAVGAISGQGETPVVEMRFSDDLGKTWSTWSEQPLAPMGLTGKQWTAEWVGLGSVSSPGRLFEFRISDPVLFIPYEVKYNEAYSR